MGLFRIVGLIVLMIEGDMFGRMKSLARERLRMCVVRDGSFCGVGAMGPSM